MIKQTKKIVIATLLACLAVSGNSGASVLIDMATVGNANNLADSTGYGAVGYEYQIGIYEVTNNQYAEFLNSVAKSDPNALYNANMGSDALGGIEQSGSSGSYIYTVKTGFENKPVNYVTLADANRFTNWLTNGQGNGSTETGSYDLTLGGAYATRMGAAPGQVQFFVASENEWYKAAFYDPTRFNGDGGYWLYATQSDTEPTASVASSLANHANFDKKVKAPLNVGSYSGSGSYYGTFDQEGNLAEFTDSLLSTLTNGRRTRRGSSFSNILTGSEYRGGDVFDVDANSIGFRVVMVTGIPEASSTALLGFSGLVVAGWVVAKKSLTAKTAKEASIH